MVSRYVRPLPRLILVEAIHLLTSLFTPSMRQLCIQYRSVRSSSLKKFAADESTGKAKWFVVPSIVSLLETTCSNNSPSYLIDQYLNALMLPSAEYLIRLDSWSENIDKRTEDKRNKKHVAKKIFLRLHGDVQYRKHKMQRGLVLVSIIKQLQKLRKYEEKTDDWEMGMFWTQRWDPWEERNSE